MRNISFFFLEILRWKLNEWSNVGCNSIDSFMEEGSKFEDSVTQKSKRKTIVINEILFRKFKTNLPSRWVTKPRPQCPPNCNYLNISRRMLDFWNRNSFLEKCIEAHEFRNEWDKHNRVILSFSTNWSYKCTYLCRVSMLNIIQYRQYNVIFHYHY